MKKMFTQTVSVVLAMGILQSFFMPVFYFFWNYIVVKMVNWANPITFIEAWLFLFGLNLFSYYFIQPDHVDSCLNQDDEEESEVEEEE